MPGLSDESFARRLGEEARDLRAFLLAVSGRPDLLEDLLSDVALEAWTHRGRYLPPEPMGPWLRGVARNVIRRAARRSSRHRMTPFASDTLEKLAQTWSATGDAQRARRGQALEACMKHLGRDERGILKGAYAEGRSHRELAKASGRSLGGLKMLLLRLRRRLRACVEERLLREGIDVR